MTSSSHWIRARMPLFVVAALVCLGAANVASRVTWQEVEDGVLWTSRAEGVVAAEIAAGTPAERVGLKRGDILIQIDNRPVEAVDDVVTALHASDGREPLRYTVLRLGSSEVIDVRLAPL